MAFAISCVTAMRMEISVKTAMRKEIDELSGMPVSQLRQEYIEAFGEQSRSNHKQFLFCRIAWRIQALAKAASLSELAAAHSKSPTTQICAFGRPGPSSGQISLRSQTQRNPQSGRRSTRGYHRRELTWNANIRAAASL
jgi:Protein of unknown function (DUF2924)